MKFSEYQELNEAFDRAAPDLVIKRNRSKFSVDGQEYVVSTSIGLSRTAMSVAFSAIDEDGTPSYELVKGDARTAMTVFATVIKVVQHHIEKYDLIRVHFSAYADDITSDAKKRKRLYTSLTKRYAEQMGWEWEEVGGDFSIKAPVVKEEPAGYSTSWGTESLDLFEVNAAAVIKAANDINMRWDLYDGAVLEIITASGRARLSTGSINSVDSWADAFAPLIWGPGEFEGVDDMQRIARIAGKIWVQGDMEVTIYKNIEHFERDAENPVSSETKLILDLM
ncbi:hypothetical protein NVP1081O_130 [Vibrio phage 1.081.O._10N.286.52.C2]|nr:hypothetical protein NVP1081O_130 [Vibrio phage 1.081.O._10N.286.52.C2]